MDNSEEKPLTQSELEDVAIHLAIDGCTEDQIVARITKHGYPEQRARLAAKEAVRRFIKHNKQIGLKIIAGGVVGLIVSYILLGLIEDTTQKVPVKFVLFFGVSIACIAVGIFKYIASNSHRPRE